MRKVGVHTYICTKTLTTVNQKMYIYHNGLEYCCQLHIQSIKQVLRLRYTNVVNQTSVKRAVSFNNRALTHSHHKHMLCYKVPNLKPITMFTRP